MGVRWWPPMIAAALLATQSADRPCPCEPSAGDAANGAQGPIRDHATPVVDYVLRARLDPDRHRIDGEGTITLHNRAARPLSELWVHLYLNAFKNDRSRYYAGKKGGFRGGTTPARWGGITVSSLDRVDGAIRTPLWEKAELSRAGDEDESEARVPLDTPLAPGASLTLSMRWSSDLPTIVARTGQTGRFVMAAQWFPKLAKLEPDGTFAHGPFERLSEFYADFGSYDVTLDVPDGFVVGATGVRLDERAEGPRRVLRYAQGDVHDFAWTAWEGFAERREPIEGVDVRVLFPRGHERNASRELAALRFAIPYFNARYGAYPYATLTVVHPPSYAPEAGGMEYPTLITTGGHALSPEAVHLIELVTIHELGHQWFYGLLASDERSWPMLDEGLNSYAEQDAMRAWLGRGSLAAFAGLEVDTLSVHAASSRSFARVEPVAQSAADFSSGRAYAALAYSRTATLLETLRRTFGDDAMRAALADYARRFRFRHPTPADLEGVIRAHLGDDAAAALHDGFFLRGTLDASLEAVRCDDARTRCELVVARRGTLVLPVVLELTADDGTTRRLAWDGHGPSKRFTFEGPPLRAVLVDPDEALPIDDDRANNHRTLEKPRGASRTLVQLVGGAAAVLGALGP